MSIEAGQTLLHYRLTAKLGEGGMGVVWRAVDTDLGRDVAIKLLPDLFAADAERLARFEREARLLASLNHPNIASIYGLHEADGVRFLAMELVEGQDLSAMLARGPLSTEEAIGLALQIAEALEAAHGNGVIHRDLKPANVMITSDNQVKVLDFGLAKAFEPEHQTASGAVSASLSPTVTSAGTIAGVILGTAAYMSPEQARGKPVDKRTDIWSFGCVLFEMLSVRRPFEGETTTDLIARIIEREPQWDALPARLPRRARDVLRRCLRKDPRERLHDIADARLELREALNEPDEPPPAASAAAVRRWAVPLAAAAGLIIGLVAGPLLIRSTTEPEATASGRGATRSIVALPESAPLALAGRSGYGVSGQDIAISPDGSRVVYNADTGATSQLYVRHFDRFDAEPLPGTEGASYPFFSPDGHWVGYFTETHLMKAPLGGGRPVLLADVRVTFGATWGGDGFIYLTHHQNKLARVADSGGPLEPLDLKELGDELTADWLQWLPGGALLVTSAEYAQGGIRHVALESGRVTSLVRDGFRGHYTPSGHLVFARGNGLYAAPMDLERAELTGPAKSALEGVWTDSVWGVAQFAVANDGTLVYAVGENWAESIPTWIDADGREEPLPVPPQIYGMPNVSPNGNHVAIHIMEAGHQVHVYDSARGNLARLTLTGTNIWPAWSRDGREVFFGRLVDGDTHFGLFRMSIDGGDSPEPVGPPMGAHVSPTGASPDGRMLVVQRETSGQASDLWIVPLDGESEPEPFLATEFAEWGARFSPDGRWIAFTSNKRGAFEVFVRPFPANDREWQVSAGGGEEPRWSRDGKTLFYRRNRRLMAVDIAGEDELIAGTPRLVLETTFHNSPGPSFAIGSDGRFLINKPVAEDKPVTRLHLVTNWFDELP